MNLCDTYEAIVPSVIALISKFARTPAGQIPLVPPIIGTGFMVSQDGIAVTNRHVAEVLPQLPKHPATGDDGYAAVMFDMTKDEEGHPSMRWMMMEIASVGMLDSFTSDAEWYGEDKPDVAFLQLKIRETPFLELASDPYYIRPGTQIATAGFPMGELPLAIMARVNQVTPFLRRGIVSSVFPFSIDRPHGFTIDVMQQGGSSGSPIFYEDKPTVVGMMASVLRTPDMVAVPNGEVQILQPTNISIGVAAHMIKLALADFRKSGWMMDCAEFPTIEEWKSGQTPTGKLTWDTFPTTGS